MSATPPNPEEEFKKFQLAFSLLGATIWLVILLVKLFVK